MARAGVLRVLEWLLRQGVCGFRALTAESLTLVSTEIIEIVKFVRTVAQVGISWMPTAARSLLQMGYGVPPSGPTEWCLMFGNGRTGPIPGKEKTGRSHPTKDVARFLYPRLTRDDPRCRLGQAVHSSAVLLGTSRRAPQL